MSSVMGIAMKDMGELIATAASPKSAIDALKADYEQHIVAKSTSSILGHVKVDGITLDSIDGVIQSKAARKAAGEHTVNTTTVETSLVTCTIPGGALGADGGMSFKVGGRIFNATGADATVTIRLKLGATTIADLVMVLPTNAISRGLTIDGLLLNATANSQRLMANLTVTDGGAEKLLSVYKSYATRGNAIATENTSTDKDFVISVQLSASSINLSVVRDMAFMKFIARG